MAHLQRIFFLWRPLLPDPKGDLVLEVAVAAECEAIVTYNVRHFPYPVHPGFRELLVGPPSSRRLASSGPATLERDA